jgi:hypothetical protein
MTLRPREATAIVVAAFLIAVAITLLLNILT